MALGGFCLKRLGILKYYGFYLERRCCIKEKLKEKWKKKKWTSLMSKLVSILPRNRGKQVLIIRQAVTETKRQGTEETTGKHTSHLKITLETNKGYNRDRDMCACACIRATSMCVCVCAKTQRTKKRKWTKWDGMCKVNGTIWLTNVSKA